MLITSSGEIERIYIQAHEEYEHARHFVHATKSRMKAMHVGKGVADHFYGTRAGMGMHVPTADVT
jgi:hypothetical protein